MGLALGSLSLDQSCLESLGWPFVEVLVWLSVRRACPGLSDMGWRKGPGFGDL